MLRGSEEQVVELADVASSLTKQDASRLVEICLQIMNGRRV